MFRLIRKIFGAIKYRYDDYQNWKMKMNEPITFKIVYTPPKDGSNRNPAETGQETNQKGEQSTDQKTGE